MEKYSDLTKLFMCLIEKASAHNQVEIKYTDTIKLYKSEIHVIDIIGQSTGIHISEIARNFGISKAAVSQLIKKIEKKAL